MTTTNRIAFSDSPNHRSASGSQQIDGSACSPTTSGPTAARSQPRRASITPSVMPAPAEMRVADEQPIERRGDGARQLAVAQRVAEHAHDAARAGQHVLRPGPEPRDAGPADEQGPQRHHRRQPSLRALARVRRPIAIDRLVLARLVELALELRRQLHHFRADRRAAAAAAAPPRRHRSATRAGRARSTITREPSRTASAMSCVTKHDRLAASLPRCRRAPPAARRATWGRARRTARP